MGNDAYNAVNAATFAYGKAGGDISQSSFYNTPEYGQMRADYAGEAGKKAMAGYNAGMMGLSPEQAEAYRVAHMSPEDQLTYKLGKFFDEMNKPLDLNDPAYQQFLSNALANADMANRSAGVSGGMAGSNLARIGARAANDYSLQRKGLGLQAAGQQAGMYGMQDQMRLNKYMIDQDAARQQYANRSGLLSGALGLVGGIGGFFAGGPAGAALGYQAGSTAGGLMSGGYQPPPNPYGGRNY